MGLCCTVIRETEVASIESFGKFDRILHPGFHCINCITENIGVRRNLQLQIFEHRVDTVTKDKITIDVKIGVHFKVNSDNVIQETTRKQGRRSVELSETSSLLESGGLHSIESIERLPYQHTPVFQQLPSPNDAIYKSMYTTYDPVGQIKQHVNSYLRGISCDHTMNEIFLSKNSLSNDLTTELNKTMQKYGYYIERALILDIDPPKDVRHAMNLVSESENKRTAQINQAEADKRAAILRAEANCEVRRLEGEGLAKQRQALTNGLKESMQHMCGDKEISIDPSALTSTILTMQYIDMLDKVGATGHNTVIMSHAPSASGAIEEQFRNAILSTHQK